MGDYEKQLRYHTAEEPENGGGRWMCCGMSQTSRTDNGSMQVAQ